MLTINKMKTIILLILLFALAVSLLVWSGNTLADQATRWPAVSQIQRVFHFDHLSTAIAELTFTSPDGKPLYKLLCRNGEYEGSPACDFSGFFYCCLTSAEGKGDSILLDKYATRDWQTRARFLEEELIGECGDYPDFGRVRTFRMRGMILTLMISDLVISSNTQDKAFKDAAFTFEIKVLPDSKATSDNPEPSRYAAPLYRNKDNPFTIHRDCRRVIERNKDYKLEVIRTDEYNKRWEEKIGKKFSIETDQLPEEK
jgi:hypothetical protein